MTGYTVHTGTSKKFASGWDQIFGDEPQKTGKKKTKQKTAAKQTKKTATAKKKAGSAGKKKTAKKNKKKTGKKKKKS